MADECADIGNREQVTFTVLKIFFSVVNFLIFLTDGGSIQMGG